MHRSMTLLALSIGAALASSAMAQAPASPAKPATFDQGVISGLGIRNIGSATMSGRIAAVAAAHDKKGDTVLYVGAASGGVWKSTDGGTTFKPKFDKQAVQSIGAIALDPKDPDNVWVGTGEAWTRNSVSIGNGVYHSTDGGETWANVGLPNSERIVKLAVDPRNGNTVLACVTGKLWSDSPERGVYRTSDGGKSWTQVLKGSNGSTGCGGMSVDAKNPERGVRVAVGFPPQGLDVPFRRRERRSAIGQRPVPLDRRRHELDRSHRRRTAGKALRSHRGRGGAIELERRVCVRRRRQERAVPLG